FLGDVVGKLPRLVDMAEELAARALGPADPAAGKVEDSGELAAHPDRPALRADVQRQRVRDFIEQVKAGPALAIDLVDESDDRHRAQAAHFEQLARLRLDPL